MGAIARDVLALEKVAKPALLRNLFLLACRYPSKALSYTKMLGQLQDAGNTTELAQPGGDKATTKWIS